MNSNAVCPNFGSCRRYCVQRPRNSPAVLSLAPRVGLPHCTLVVLSRRFGIGLGRLLDFSSCIQRAWHSAQADDEVPITFLLAFVTGATSIRHLRGVSNMLNILNSPASPISCAYVALVFMYDVFWLAIFENTPYFYSPVVGPLQVYTFTI